MALVLLLVIWLVTFASAYLFVAKVWWLPAGASAAAAQIDHHFQSAYLLMGIAFIAAQLALGFFVWRYRERNSAGRSQRAFYSHGNNRLEAAWTVATLLLFAGMGLQSGSMWAAERMRPAAPQAIQVEVTGAQFAWYFRYAGRDGKFGATRAELRDASGGSRAAIGLDETDVNSKDDVVASTMVVPVNREVELILRAEDVIHSFFVPAMRFKQDAVPGLAIRVHFKPIIIGSYEIACAELCGLGHYRMHGTLKVVSPQEFAAWLAAREAEKQ